MGDRSRKLDHRFAVPVLHGTGTGASGGLCSLLEKDEPPLFQFGAFHTQLRPSYVRKSLNDRAVPRDGHHSRRRALRSHHHHIILQQLTQKQGNAACKPRGRWSRRRGAKFTLFETEGFYGVTGHEEAVSGGSLNYDELVVYKNEAIRPSYLLMYRSSKHSRCLYWPRNRPSKFLRLLTLSLGRRRVCPLRPIPFP